MKGGMEIEELRSAYRLGKQTTFTSLVRNPISRARFLADQPAL